MDIFLSHLMKEKDNVRLKLIESFELYRPDDPVPEIKIED